MLKPAILWLLLPALLPSGAKADGREEELGYLRTVLPHELLDVAHLEIASRKNVVIATNGQEECLGLRISGDQPSVHGGMRAEVSVDYPYEPGDTVRYAWQFMLPGDFVSDAPQNRWWVIGQWHDQPNKKKGESWLGFPSRSPPVLLGLGEVAGRPGLVLSYGPTDAKARQQGQGPIPLDRGVWYRIAVVIHWSRGAEGSASVFLNDSTNAAMHATGANMNNDVQHYLKVGMYRHPDIHTDNWIFLDHIEVSRASARVRAGGEHRPDDKGRTTR